MDSTGDKLYYKIGEAAKIIQVEPYVIRYWETEFSSIKPLKLKSSHRLYSKNDIEKLLKIKDCLYNKKFTIKGAKKALAELSVTEKNRYLLSKTIDELKSIRGILIKKVNQ
jgi:DNA-binding transcriptional MerR regulator